MERREIAPVYLVALAWEERWCGILEGNRRVALWIVPTKEETRFEGLAHKPFYYN